MQLNVYNELGEVVETMEVSEQLFNRPYIPSLVHTLVVAVQANQRKGSRAQKDRGQVSHTTKKPYKQKGTGRARAGMSSSPIWRGGGKAFPSNPDENFSHKVNKKVYKSGMAVIFSQLLRENRLSVLDHLQIAEPKTKLLANKLKAMNKPSALLVSLKAEGNLKDENLLLACRNLAKAKLVPPRSADPVKLLSYSHIFIMRDSVQVLHDMYV
ncbi:MAG: 50S ribosomal protein L4 [Gammaproteobacteria bacterium]|nr:50S ribosomal protein L4 [Gammaproteobacteria bacterium]